MHLSSENLLFVSGEINIAWTVRCNQFVWRIYTWVTRHWHADMCRKEVQYNVDQEKLNCLKFIWEEFQGQHNWSCCLTLINDLFYLIISVSCSLSLSLSTYTLFTFITQNIRFLFQTTQSQHNNKKMYKLFIACSIHKIHFFLFKLKRNLATTNFVGSKTQ